MAKSNDIIKPRSKIDWYKNFELLFNRNIFHFKAFSIVDSEENEDEVFNYRRAIRLCRFNDLTITKVYASSVHYVIFESLEGSTFEVDAEDEYLKRLNKIIPYHNSLTGFLTKSEIKRFSTRIATGLRFGLEDHLEEGLQTFNEIKEKVINIRENNHKLTYLMGALSMSIITLLFLIANQFEYFIATKWDLVKLSHVLFFSSLGGFFSVCSGYKKIITGIPEAREMFYFINGMTRIVIALLAGIVAYQFLMADLFFSKFKGEMYAMNCLMITVGFVETLIPKFLEKVASEKKPKP